MSTRPRSSMSRKSIARPRPPRSTAVGYRAGSAGAARRPMGGQPALGAPPHSAPDRPTVLRDLAVQPEALERVGQDRRGDREDKQPQPLRGSALPGDRGALRGDGAHPPPP